jgi:D-arabinose 1-dehydrogenase-like Zn-dependent alcohol dehydrogenase
VKNGTKYIYKEILYKVKNIFSNQGERVLKESHEPWCGAFEIKVKVKYTAVSFGTESGGVKALSLKSMLLDKTKWQKAFEILKTNLNIFEVIKKFRGIRKSYSSLGYSGIGEVIEIGNRVTKNTFKMGDIVHIGGEYATHSSIVSVPQNFVFKLEKKEKLFLYALPTIASVPIHAINHAKDLLIDKPNIKVLVIGGGIIGTFAGLYAKKLGFDIYIDDLSEKVLADNFFPRYNAQNIDLFVVCTTSMNGIDKYIEKANDGAVMSVVGETPLEVSRELLEDKYMSIRFCKSFGYGRGDKSYELGITNIGDKNFHYTIKKNIDDAISLIENLSDNEKFLKVINLYDLDNENVDYSKINIIDWSNK